MGRDWLQEFMYLTSSAPIDYVGLNCYNTNDNHCIFCLKAMHATSRKAVVVSEIASFARDGASVYGFTIQVAISMDETERIFKCGFFGSMRKLTMSVRRPS